MGIVDTKKVIELDGTNYQVHSIKTGNFYTGTQVILKRVKPIPYMGVAISYKETLTFLKHFGFSKDSNDILQGKWYQLRKPMTNDAGRMDLITNSTLIKPSKPISSYLDNVIKQ